MDNEKNIAQQSLYESSPDKIDTFLWKKHPNEGYHAHFHSAVEMCYVAEGSVDVEINRQTFTAEKGDLVVVNPFEIHRYYKTGDAYVFGFIFSKNYLLEFKNLYGDKILNNLLTDKEYNSCILEPLEVIPTSFYNNNTLSPMAKSGYINLVLDKIISRYGVTNPNESLNEIIDILKYIYNNYQQEISLETLAKKFSYSKTSISRLISKYLHTDLRCFVNDLRVEQAENLLKSSKFNQFSVIQIATMCGFDSAATFYRAYKKRYNHLPRKEC